MAIYLRFPAPKGRRKEPFDCKVGTGDVATRQGVKTGVQERLRREPSLLAVFQESYELRVSSTVAVTRIADARQTLLASECPAIQGYRTYPMSQRRLAT